MDRRDFFKLVADEIVGVVETKAGKPSFKLSALPDMPMDRLTSLIPLTLIEEEVEVESGNIVGRLLGNPEPVVLFPEDAMSWAIFESFDGILTIGESAKYIAARFCLKEDEALAKVRQLFLSLVGRGVVVPGNAPPK